MNLYPYILEVNQDPLYRRINVSGFFKVIGRAAITALSTGEPTTALAAGSKETVRNLEHHLTPSHRAFELILNGMEAACVQLIQQEKLEFTENEALLLSKRMEEEAQEINIQLTPHFFTAPQELPAIQDLVPVLVYWLEGLNLTNSQAIAIAQQLPKLFFRIVVQEWGRRREYYQSVEDYFKHPFVKAWEEEYYMERYYEELKQLYHQPALGDQLLPLSKIYQEPDFLVYQECLKKSIGREVYHKDGFVGAQHLYQSLHHYVAEWLSGNTTKIKAKGKKLLILLGQPGQGKSSFCYKTLSQLLEANPPQKRVYFVRLRDLNTKEQLIQEPFVVLENYLKKKTKLSTIHLQESILILDGLDELYMSEGLTNENLKVFYEKLEHEVEQEQGLHLILTSRYNYLNIEAIDKDISTVVKLAPLSLEKQKQWLGIYKKAHQESTLSIEKLEKIDEDEQLEHIKELIEQPILLHLIAQSGVEIDSKLDKAKIYEELFDTLIHRKWEEEQLKQYKGLSKKKHQQLFKQWLQEIAHRIHQSDQGYIHQHQIEKLDSITKLNNALKTPIKIKDAMKNLLVAFYFRNVAEGAISGRHPVEFLHLSLQEYLAAEYIWNKIIEISQEGAKTNVQLFKSIFKLFHKKGLNENMSSLLLELIEQEEEGIRLMVRTRWKKVFPLCLKHQFLYSYEVKENMGQPLVSMENSFKSFWLVLSALAVNKQMNKDLVEEKYSQNLATLLRTFGGYGMQFYYLDLRYAKLMSADLSDAKLMSADLRYANLMSADLRYANLMSADLSDANLMSADLMSADLRYANLSDANLSDVNLSNAKLRYANLMSANLSDADLRYTNLRYANLRYANLRYANLSDANLSNAKLRYANLMSANLSDADLSDADLSDADLSDAKLTDANLNLSKTNNLNFFQTLKKQNCIGVEELEKKYQVDPTPNYESWDTQQQQPYYIIRQRK